MSFCCGFLTLLSLQVKQLVSLLFLVHSWQPLHSITVLSKLCKGLGAAHIQCARLCMKFANAVQGKRCSRFEVKVENLPQHSSTHTALPKSGSIKKVAVVLISMFCHLFLLFTCISFVRYIVKQSFFQEVPQMRLLRGSATVVTRQANEDEIKEATSTKKVCTFVSDLSLSQPGHNTRSSSAKHAKEVLHEGCTLSKDHGLQLEEESNNTRPTQVDKKKLTKTESRPVQERIRY